MADARATGTRGSDGRGSNGLALYQFYVGAPSTCIPASTPTLNRREYEGLLYD
jgi:hypothetical protein